MLRELVSSARHSFALPAFCAMPDHLRFLATANSSAADLAPFVSAFKQRTGYRYLKACRGKLWQPRYYEHILREAEDPQGVVLYIWSNPVRAKICLLAIEYPLSGSTTMDWKDRYRCLGGWKPHGGQQKEAGLKSCTTFRSASGHGESLLGLSLHFRPPISVFSRRRRRT